MAPAVIAAIPVLASAAVTQQETGAFTCVDSLLDQIKTDVDKVIKRDAFFACTFGEMTAPVIWKQACESYGGEMIERSTAIERNLAL